MSTPTRHCPATHAEDIRPCIGPANAALIVDQAGSQTEGCVLHGAVLLASLDHGQVVITKEHPASQLVFELATGVRPFAIDGDELPAAARAGWLNVQHRLLTEAAGVPSTDPSPWYVDVMRLVDEYAATKARQAATGTDEEKRADEVRVVTLRAEIEGRLTGR